MTTIIERTDRITGTVCMDGDKSIFHRAVICAALADGTSVISNSPAGADCLSTLSCLSSLGIKTDMHDKKCTVSGSSFHPARTVLDAGNSGSSIRMLAGILSWLPFETEITGDESLKRRPMKRIIEPLTLLGANISSAEGMKAPLRFKQAQLKAAEYSSPIASAQVKSSFIFAALKAEGISVFREKIRTRTHLENLLTHIGADIEASGGAVKIKGHVKLSNFNIAIPGDISSAAYLIAAALILPKGRVTVKNIGLNQFRTGFIDALREMNGNIEISNVRDAFNGEPAGDITALYSPNLKGIEIQPSQVPSMIDELPLLAVVALKAEGKTKVRGAEELRVKECDRISAIVLELSKLGASVKEYHDGFEIEGRQTLRGAFVTPHSDHRIAMALGIAALAAEGKTHIIGSEWAGVSFPNFFQTLAEMSKC